MPTAGEFSRLPFYSPERIRIISKTTSPAVQLATAATATGISAMVTASTFLSQISIYILHYHFFGFDVPAHADRRERSGGDGFAPGAGLAPAKRRCVREYISPFPFCQDNTAIATNIIPWEECSYTANDKNSFDEKRIIIKSDNNTSTF